MPYSYISYASHRSLYYRDYLILNSYLILSTPTTDLIYRSITSLNIEG